MSALLFLSPAPVTSASRHQSMIKLSLVSTNPYVEQLSIGAGRRALAISLAVLITGILLFLLLSFGLGEQPDHMEVPVSVVSLQAAEFAENAPAPSSAEPTEPQPASPAPALEEPPPLRRTDPLPPPPAAPQAAPTMLTPTDRPPSQAPPRIGVRPPSGRVYGPPNTGGSSSSRDTERVGTAPNGEPLYAAAWYREPSKDELRGYLSTASGPGWGLIACRTAPDYRVEDCVGLDEYPNGSQINRAILAAAWQFRVRPPRIGGQSMAGSWVRIRIDYGIERR